MRQPRFTGPSTGSMRKNLGCAMVFDLARMENGSHFGKSMRQESNRFHWSTTPILFIPRFSTFPIPKLGPPTLPLGSACSICRTMRFNGWMSLAIGAITTCHGSMGHQHLVVDPTIESLAKSTSVFLGGRSLWATKAVFTETDAAWIDVADELFWLKDRSRVVWLSERSGWRHIYIVSSENGSSQAVTSGEFDVMEVVGVDEEDQRIYFYASPDNASQKYLYRVHFDGSRMER